MFDVILQGGTVFDGTGALPTVTDIGIRSDRITAVTDLASAEAAQLVDVSGLVVTPGFVDTHTHTDLAQLLDDDHADIKLASLRQGVTTEVCGNCGSSPFPSTADRRELMDSRARGVFGPTMRAYDSCAQYRSAIGSVPLAVNLAPLVGHGSIRSSVLGVENRHPNDDEMRRMLAVLDLAFDEGAFGLSTGLIYAPGIYTRTEEIIALARSAAEWGRPYTTHMRDEADCVIDAIKEAIRIGQEAGVAVHISHHKLAGSRNHGRSYETLALLDEARAEGLDVTIDVYPYTAGSTGMSALLPPWALEGGMSRVLERLIDRTDRLRIIRDLDRGAPDWQHLAGLAGWENIVVAGATKQAADGQTIASLADLAGLSPAEFVCNFLLEEEGRPMVILHLMADEDVRNIIAWPHASIGSDGIPKPGKQHPRLAGAFARVLGRYVREQRILSLTEAIRKMTSLAAARFGLQDRGEIRPGNIADIAVFDPETVADLSTYGDPFQGPAGIHHVLVCGRFAIMNGDVTSTRSGQILHPTR